MFGRQPVLWPALTGPPIVPQRVLRSKQEIV
jgi:hypothetical protein